MNVDADEFSVCIPSISYGLGQYRRGVAVEVYS
jgi:hypothetical protein